MASPVCLFLFVQQQMPVCPILQTKQLQSHFHYIILHAILAQKVFPESTQLFLSFTEI